jgi:glyoxylase-like metal-dependent hydrolase (beta-lactamase superfamily II)
MVERVVVGPWKTNCYIFSSTKKECIIIDPGGSEAEIASRVDVLNMVPVGIALTHGHVDHLAALGKLRDSYAARGYKLPIAINPSDRRFLGTGGRETHREDLEFLGLDEESFFGVDADELPRADVRLKEGDRVFDMDLVVFETPGHTPGSLCFYGEKEGILFSGDTLFFDGVGRTDLPGGSEKKLRESIQKKIAVLPPETRVFPGHGPFTTVEREKRGNVYFRGMIQEPQPVAVQRPSPVLQDQSLTPSKPTVSVKVSTGAMKRVVKGPSAPKGKSRDKRPASSAKKPIAKQIQAKRRLGSAKGPMTAVRRPSKRDKPSGSISAAGQTAKPAQGKNTVAVKKRPADSQSKRKSAQASRSTKAPGAGRKPAR